jgi:hypothetical protein
VRKTWRKTRFRELTVQQQLLLLYLWTGPEVINPGVYYIGVPTIADDLPFSEKSVRSSLKSLEAQGWFRYDSRAKVIFFPKWADYDRPKNQSVIISYLNHVKDLPDTELKGEFLKTLMPYLQQFSVSLPEELVGLCGHKPESMPAQSEHKSESMRATLIHSYSDALSNAVRPYSSLSEEELDNENPEHRGEILQRVLDYYNERLKDIGERTFCRDVLTRDEIGDFEGCLRQGVDSGECKTAIDGCFACKYNRENRQLKFGTIFKPDRIGRYVALAKKPEVDDAGDEIAKRAEHHGIY